MADMQRARLIAGELPRAGWEAEILAPAADFQTEFSRLQGEGVVFPDVPVHEVKPWLPGLFARLGSRNVGIRAAVPVGRAGLELLRSGRFDAVYFSTTQHWLTCNGARWRRRTGVPYVADLHDPVYLEKKVYFVSRHRMKERVARHLGKTIERLAIGRADGLVSVSGGYVEDAGRRQSHAPWKTAGHVLVQPFPADIPALRAGQARPVQPESGEIRVVYVGAGGSIMAKGWSELLRCLAARAVPPALRIRLFGTDTNWAANQRRPLQDLATEAGLESVVCEEPARISYGDSMALTAGAHGLLVLGVDDPSYRPSKLQTCLASGLPVLAVLRGDSDLCGLLGRCGPGVHVVRFGAQGGFGADNEAATAAFVEEAAGRRRWEPEGRNLLKAEEAAFRHAELFDRICSSRRT